MNLFKKLFNKIFNKKKDKAEKKENDEQVIAKIKENLDDIKFDETEDGRLVVEFYDAHRNFMKYNNMTSLVINNEPRMVGDKKLYDCMIKWWKQEDPENEEEREENRSAGRI